MNHRWSICLYLYGRPFCVWKDRLFLEGRNRSEDVKAGVCGHVGPMVSISFRQLINVNFLSIILRLGWAFQPNNISFFEYRFVNLETRLKVGERILGFYLAFLWGFCFGELHYVAWVDGDVSRRLLRGAINVDHFHLFTPLSTSLDAFFLINSWKCVVATCKLGWVFTIVRCHRLNTSLSFVFRLSSVKDWGWLLFVRDQEWVVVEHFVFLKTDHWIPKKMLFFL